MVYEVDVTGGQREGVGELRSGGDYGRGRRRARWVTTMHHNVRRSEEGPLTQQSNLDDGDNNTTTTKRTKMSNSRSGRVERIRGRKRRRERGG